MDAWALGDAWKLRMEKIGRVTSHSIEEAYKDKPITWFVQINALAWWRHQMETFSALLALCEGNPPVTSLRPVTRSFDVSLTCAWTNGWAINQDIGDLRLCGAYYDVTVMGITKYTLKREDPNKTRSRRMSYTSWEKSVLIRQPQFHSIAFVSYWERLGLCNVDIIVIEMRKTEKRKNCNSENRLKCKSYEDGGVSPLITFSHFVNESFIGISKGLFQT